MFLRERVTMKKSETNIQRDYYARTARHYDEWHLDIEDEHYFALSFLMAMMDFLDIESVLDVGSGTGRAIAYIKTRKPSMRVVGIEPVGELREIGRRKGLSESELIDGDVTELAFTDGEFDLVCEFGVLHHIKNHQIAVAEMLRVARKAIFISDSNNFGQGPEAKRAIKQIINAMGLWGLVDFVKTGGKGYTISEGDGLSYSYSVFSDYKLIKHHCRSVHVLNTGGGGTNPYRCASHVALLGIKK